ncbi:uncharacterized protein FMAN_16244 [Fusarium mangiferae]|uniref:Clr5 domain-containing protein n=1 Tax=Fusarium mangiferae TaxID=192010 RepID=A0A1L7U981_FUSMA|nr:uncharacterized protein FMAN_16244 [Fusarium mangiferae]CVL07298.1 uncharacterized protein FMAN_16244 [Fusarium mangiferae]
MGRTPRIPDAQWERQKQTIERIYMTEQRSLKHLGEGMTAIHGFIASEREYRRNFEKWEFKKNGTEQAVDHVSHQDRKRIAKAPPSRLMQKSFILKFYIHNLCPEFRWHDNIERELWRFKNATDTIINGSFASGKDGWIANHVSFIAPSIGMDSFQQWEHLNSQSSAIVALTGMGIDAEVRGSIEELFQNLERLQSFQNRKAIIPQLIYIWRVCLNLFKARLPLPQPKTGESHSILSINPLVPALIQRLEVHLTAKFGRKDPACEIMAALLTIFRHTPQKFKLALECGYFMTIKRFEAIAGSGHPMVLRMWSNYGRAWGPNAFFDIDRIGEVLQHINSYVDYSDVETGPQSILSFLNLTEMQVAKESFELGNLSQYCAMLPYPSHPTRLEDFALELRKRAMRILQTGDDRSNALILDAFVFVTELLALRLFVRLCPQFSLEILDEAIELLQKGGPGCVVWASRFSKDRLSLLKGRGSLEDFHIEKVRMNHIRRKLPTLQSQITKLPRAVSTARTREFRKQRREERYILRGYLQSMLDSLLPSPGDEEH